MDVFLFCFVFVHCGSLQNPSAMVCLKEVLMNFRLRAITLSCVCVEGWVGEGGGKGVSDEWGERGGSDGYEKT